tara:strand:- start:208 stop:417 length:210 start_codon:yes stop_codon:yes gene_type:complete
MKIKVHWILDGIAELDADSPQDAEKQVEKILSAYLENENDLTNKLGAKAIQGKAFLPGSDDDEVEIIDN